VHVLEGERGSARILAISLSIRASSATCSPTSTLGRMAGCEGGASRLAGALPPRAQFAWALPLDLGDFDNVLFVMAALLTKTIVRRKGPRAYDLKSLSRED
jgi:hypothetical protein